MRIAMVSEHASPLATVGGVDAGGQNVHVAALACELARRGHEVEVFTRRDDPGLPERVEMHPNLTVRHVDAGPPEAIPKDELLPYMPELGRQLLLAWSETRPAVVHAHFWMSGLAALDACEALDLPLVMTFHALGVVKRRHQGRKDTSPAGRLDAERRLARSASLVVATCTDEVFELARMGVRVSRVRVVPCGVDLGVFRPSGLAEPRAPDLHRVEAKARGGAVHQPLHGERDRRPADAAIGRHRAGVRRDAAGAHGVGLEIVGARQLGHGHERLDAAGDRVA